MSYNKIIEELIAENERLKDEKTILNHKLETQLRNNTKIKIERDDMMLNLRKLHRTKWDLKDKNAQLKKQYEKLYKPHEVFKFKEQIERLRIDKYKYIELYKQKYDEKTRLQNELFSEHLKQVETEDFIDKLKKELKEYRGY